MPKAKVAKKEKVGSVAKEATEAPKLDFHLEIQANDFVYKCDAVSLEEGLRNFVSSPMFPVAVKSRVFVKFGSKGKEKQISWPIIRARRMFNLLSIGGSKLEFIGGKLTSDLING